MGTFNFRQNHTSKKAACEFSGKTKHQKKPHIQFSATITSMYQSRTCKYFYLIINDFYLEAPEDDRLQKFYDYLLKTYIKSHSLFPPTLWASVTVSEKRTTNGCESFHKQLNGLFYRSHPVIFELVDRLQEVVFENSFKLKGSTKKIKASDLKKYRWEEETMAMFDAGDISRKKFL